MVSSPCKSMYAALFAFHPGRRLGTLPGASMCAAFLHFWPLRGGAAKPGEPARPGHSFGAELIDSRPGFLVVFP